MEASITKFPHQINPDFLQEGALNIISSIRPEWPENKITYKIFTDGITNRLIGAYYDRWEDMILFRVYGENTDLFIDRKLEYRNMRTMYKAGLSAPIYCTFLNGISYGFTPGKVLDQVMVRDDKISSLIAENMARMHTLKPLVSQTSRPDHFDKDTQACLLPGLSKFLALSDSSAFSLKSSCKRSTGTCDHEKLALEVSFLEKELPKLKSPIVFCHNDLLLKNIIFDETQDKVTFIDFEYSDYNYQAFDIANHFCEFCGVDAFDSSLYPDKEFQMKWLRTYLHKWHLLNGDTVIPTDFDAQLDCLYDSVNKFTLAAHLYWGLWALVQAANSSIDFDYLGFAIKRLEEYFKRKNELFLVHNASLNRGY